jgi:hypothetical protein
MGAFPTWNDRVRDNMGTPTRDHIGPVDSGPVVNMGDDRVCINRAHRILVNNFRTTLDSPMM